MEKHLTVSKSDKFNVDSTASLSLFLYPESIFIFGKDQNEAILAIHKYEVEAEKILELLYSDELLSLSVPVKVFPHSGNFVLVPGALFTKGEGETYLNFASEQGEDAFHFSSGLESGKIQLVGGMSNEIYQALLAKYPEVAIHHGASSFLSYLFHQRQNFLGQEILVNLIGSKMYAACFTDQELVSFGMFDLDTQEDLVKYPRALMAQHGYNPAHARITVIGKSESIQTDDAWGKQYFHQYISSEPKPNQNLHSGMDPVENFGILEAFWQFG